MTRSSQARLARRPALVFSSSPHALSAPPLTAPACRERAAYSEGERLLFVSARNGYGLRAATRKRVAQHSAAQRRVDRAEPVNSARSRRTWGKEQQQKGVQRPCRPAGDARSALRAMHGAWDMGPLLACQA